ncbi:hypothetical protein HMPREF9630_01356 [Peptoanaerobacter stomatis]|uniref:PF01594 domain protein n=1 Tax=Peptoanaerobacter stomatis TaxID=796937 RepID=V9HRI6_9FIRM|nr:AI-2E family transporter [Peptoanaerobacter stomatis]EHL17831.1 hypothetical protein HMPREF9630_01356 [Peptoanaerobacter stomatis]
MDNCSYKKILKLIIIANLLFFSLANLTNIYNIVGNILNLFIPVIVGICIAFILNIPMMFFEKLIGRIIRGQGTYRFQAIFITIIVFIFSIYFITSMIIPEIANSINEISTKLNSVDSVESFLKLHGNLKIFDNIGIDISSMIDSAVNFIKKSSVLYASTTIQSILSLTATFFSGLISLFIGIVFSIYILAQKENLIEQAKRLILAIFGNERSEHIVEFFKVVNTSFSGFIAGQGTESVILGFLFLISMSLLGIPKAIPISAIIGVFSLVPLFGVAIACVYGVLSIVIVEPIKALWFLILFLILQQLEGNLIYPRVVGKSVGLPGIWVLFAITVIGGFAGFLGMIVAVPTMSVIYTLVERFVNNRLNRL